MISPPDRCRWSAHYTGSCRGDHGRAGESDRDEPDPVPDAEGVTTSAAVHLVSEPPEPPIYRPFFSALSSIATMMAVVEGSRPRGGGAMNGFSPEPPENVSRTLAAGSRSCAGQRSEASHRCG